MVLTKNSFRAAVIPLALTSIIILEGCKKDDEIVLSRTDLLIGDWKITEVNGYDFSTRDYNYLFKFNKGGDFDWCYEDPTDASNDSCYSGKWKWQDADEKTLFVNQFIGFVTDFELELDVIILTETKLEGDLTSTYDDGAGSTDSYTQPVKFVKVN